jgi:hypothetical protein
VFNYHLQAALASERRRELRPDGQAGRWPWPGRPRNPVSGRPAVLRDGSEVLIRPIRGADAPLLADGFARLSLRSRQPTMEQGLRTALEIGDVEDACRAYVNILWQLLDWVRLGEAERYLTESIQLAEDTEFLGFLSYMHVERARLELARGSWDEAVRLAGLSVNANLPVRCAALTVLSRVKVRLGQPDVAGLLKTAWALAVKAGEPQRLGPAAAVRAEAAWLRGDHAAALAIAGPVYEEAERLGDRVYQAELGYWLARAGRPVKAGGDHPYAVQAAGRWREAAALWEAAGCPYEHAAALAESPDPQHLLAALEMLDELGLTGAGNRG